VRRGVARRDMMRCYPPRGSQQMNSSMNMYRPIRITEFIRIRIAWMYKQRFTNGSEERTWLFVEPGDCREL